MNPYIKYFFHFAPISKSTLSTQELTSYDDVSLDLEVTIDKNKRRTLVIAAAIIKIEIIIWKIKNCAKRSCCMWVFYLL